MDYQIGTFTYNEGNMTPNIILEHEKEFSEKELYNMQHKIMELFPDILSNEEIAEQLCKLFGFKIKKFISIDTSWMYGF